jgi:hypothetical protein
MVFPEAVVEAVVEAEVGELEVLNARQLLNRSRRRCCYL